MLLKVFCSFVMAANGSKSDLEIITCLKVDIRIEVKNRLNSRPIKTCLFNSINLGMNPATISLKLRGENEIF